MSFHSDLKSGVEVVDGQIVGSTTVVGQLVYQGRPQGGRLYAASEGALRDTADRKRREIEADCGAAYGMIFPDRNAWALRIYD